MKFAILYFNTCPPLLKEKNKIHEQQQQKSRVVLSKNNHVTHIFVQTVKNCQNLFHMYL